LGLEEGERKKDDSMRSERGLCMCIAKKALNAGAGKWTGPNTE